MKRYSIQLILRILLLLVGLILLLYSLHFRLWSSTLLSVLLVVYAVYLLYRLHWKMTQLMERIERCLRYKETTLRIPAPFKDKRIVELSNNLTEAITLFRNQLSVEESNHQYYKLLLDKVDSALLVCRRNGRVEWCNRTATELLNSPVALPEDLLNSILNKEKIIHLKHNGKELEMAAEASLFASHGNKFLLIGLTNIHNLLERNEMESWQKLVRVLTHEIMNSITPIISLSETISERMVGDNPSSMDYSIMHQAMQTIHRRSKGLLTFVENYRRLTKLPAPVFNPFTVDVLFEDLKKLFPIDIIHFEMDTTGVSLNADRIQIEQVLINLIKNAVEACKHREAPEVRIRCFMENGAIRISVTDNGEGILPEVLDKIFVPFFTTKPSGSGIGLTLCKQIMSQHNANLNVVSENDKGSSFILSF